MKQLQEWVTELRAKYKENIFFRTRWNIVIFHTFFVVVMVIVFGFILYFTKVNIFTTLSAMLDTIALGGTVDASLITQASQEIDFINFVILSGMIILAVISGVLASQITLEPTREEFARRKRFITAIAHELRTPLAVMRTNNEVALFDLPPNSPIREVVIQNIEETKTLTNILNNLVIFSRVENANTLPFEGVSMSKTIEDTIKKLTQFAERKKVTISHTPHELGEIFGNKTALEQALYNTIKNAIIYSKHDGGTVTVSSGTENGELWVSIADTGVGIPKKELEHIFEPFFRVNPDSSQFASGTGLGLALVLEIVKLHAGSISVQSTEGIGTTFTLRFPIPKTPIDAEAKPSATTLGNRVTFSFKKQS